MAPVEPRPLAVAINCVSPALKTRTFWNCAEPVASVIARRTMVELMLSM
ncbi:MAG: hypothetical protein U0802_10605 [Candidatus Binatia bacterium]